MKKTITSLLKDFRNSPEKPHHPKKLSFIGVEGYDVYNPTAPFLYQGKTLILARVEKRDSEISQAIFFEKKNDAYVKRDDLAILDLQDPCITLIDGQFIIGGTYVYHENNRTIWYTKFYKGSSLVDLEPFFDSPLGMKDVRLIELKDGRIGVFSRPQGDKGGRGKIGFDIIDNLDTLTRKIVDDAPLLEQFVDEEWGGANALYLLNNGHIGVLGHIANFSQGNIRHYYAMAFVVDPKTKQAKSMKIIAERDNFLPGPSKRDDLIDVLFSAGLVLHNQDSATLYVGVSDCEVQSIEIKNPFN